MSTIPFVIHHKIRGLSVDKLAGFKYEVPGEPYQGHCEVHDDPGVIRADALFDSTVDFLRENAVLCVLRGKDKEEAEQRGCGTVCFVVRNSEKNDPAFKRKLIKAKIGMDFGHITQHAIHKKTFWRHAVADLGDVYTINAAFGNGPKREECISAVQSRLQLRVCENFDQARHTLINENQHVDVAMSRQDRPGQYRANSGQHR